jgi:hypothetical protein
VPRATRCSQDDQQKLQGRGRGCKRGWLVGGGLAGVCRYCIMCAGFVCSCPSRYSLTVPFAPISDSGVQSPDRRLRHAPGSVAPRPHLPRVTFAACPKSRKPPKRRRRPGIGLYGHAVRSRRSVDSGTLLLAARSGHDLLKTAREWPLPNGSTSQDFGLGTRPVGHSRVCLSPVLRLAPVPWRGYVLSWRSPTEAYGVSIARETP